MKHKVRTCFSSVIQNPFEILEEIRAAPSSLNAGFYWEVKTKMSIGKEYDTEIIHARVSVNLSE